VISQEGGRYDVTRGYDSPRDGEVTPDILLGGEDFIVRAIASTEVRTGSKIPSWYLTGRQTEKEVDAQRRIAQDFYATVIDTAPN